MKPCVSFTAIIAIMVCSQAIVAQNTRVPWFALSGGFGAAGTNNSEVTTAIAQPFVGRSMMANTIVENGFLVHPLLRGPLVGVPEEELLPTTYALYQNYPNPFNPSTTIRYSLPMKTHISFKIYDVLGREVATLVDNEEGPGRKSVQWNANGSASGVYFYKLSSPDFTETKRLLLLK